MTKRIYRTIKFQTVTAQTFVFYPLGPLRIPKWPSLGPIFPGTLSRGVCARMNFNHRDLKNLKSIPLYSLRAFQQFLNRLCRSTLSFVLLVYVNSLGMIILSSVCSPFLL